ADSRGWADGPVGSLARREERVPGQTPGSWGVRGRPIKRWIRPGWPRTRDGFEEGSREVVGVGLARMPGPRD
ncbi:MAG: hypothetical protein ACKO3P_10690, partial [Planctomycetaceae bacterium]